MTDHTTRLRRALVQKKVAADVYPPGFELEPDEEPPGGSRMGATLEHGGRQFEDPIPELVFATSSHPKGSDVKRELSDLDREDRLKVRDKIGSVRSMGFQDQDHRRTVIEKRGERLANATALSEDVAQTILAEGLKRQM